MSDERAWATAPPRAGAKTVPLQAAVPLSASRLWDWQAQFFATQGVAAWQRTVPFQITSNVFIAHSYAQIIARYLQDLASQGAVAAGEPVYIIELGTGSGRFSYYCISQLISLCKILRISIKPCYVMTDFVKENLEFWNRQPLFQQFIADGYLDMTILDLDQPAPLRLQHSQRLLSPQHPGQAVVCLANYVFDSTRCDLFYLKDQRLFEGLIALAGPPELGTAQGAAAWPAVSCSLRRRRIRPALYYADPLWNAILEEYTQDPSLAGYFVFPTAMLKSLAFVEQLGGGRLMLLSSDKGYTHLHQIAGQRPPTLTCHGSFSVSVNYDAVRRYAMHRRGVAFEQQPSDELHTGVYILGSPLEDLPETALAVEHFVGRRGPEDFYRIYKQFRDSPPAELATLIAHLRSAHWDPTMVSWHIKQLLENLENAGRNLRETLRDGIRQSEQWIYPIPGMPDHFFNLASLHLALGDTDDAVRLFNLSVKHFAGDFAAFFNLGLAHFRSGDTAAAIQAFTKAAEHETGGRQAEAWLLRLRRPAC